MTSSNGRTTANAETETDAVNRVKRFTLILWVVSGLAFFIVGAGIIGVAIGVIHPIAKMTRVMKRLADGEMNDDVPALTRDDEVGAMAKAVQVFKENALRD